MRLQGRYLGGKLESDPSLVGVTSFAGLPELLDASRALGLSDDLAELGLYRRDPGRREVRWSECLLALLAAGGERLSDVRTLREDPGLRALLGESGLPDDRRLGEFLERFHQDELVEGVRPGIATIPAESPPLRRLATACRKLIARVQHLSPSRTATLDWDGQVFASHKAEALWSYKGFRGFAPVLVSWAEQGLVLHDQFRPGNVPSEFGVLDVVKEALERLPQGIETIRFRGDAHAYNIELMAHLSRRGVRYSITADMLEPLRQKIRQVQETAWKPLRILTGDGWIPSGDHWAEVEYVSGEQPSLKVEPCRYVVIRYTQRMARLEEARGGGALPGIHAEHDFPLRYCAIATTMTEPGDAIIRHHRERFGGIERLFKVLVHDQAATKLPSGKYGANAAWYRFNVLLHNLVQALRLLGLPPELVGRDLKGLRFRLFRLAARVVRGPSRTWILRVPPVSRALEWLRELRQAIRSLPARLAAAHPT